MTIKDYQQDVIDDLGLFLQTLDEAGRLDTAFTAYWQKKPPFGNSLFSVNTAYDNSVKGVPRVTAKVPTAGGKTYIACNALRKIFNSMPEEKTKAVVWFVPSDTILTQTLRNLSDPNHPYREKINADFNNEVVVVDKESALVGKGISPTKVSDQLTIFVLSISSFIETVRGNKLPKAYRQNGHLADYTNHYDKGEQLIEGVDETALIQVIAHLNPVVVIDESHNFESELRMDTLNLINPSFILELTATPRDKSNIFSYVDAKKLKDADMVKLPVIVYNHQTRRDVMVSAIQLQKSLERKAKAMEEAGGEYIRPIVLFQAQPKTDEDNETFENVKAKLLGFGIPEEQIKIKTSGKNEIGKLDLMSKDCPVRYIITVNALKEGWDCPFAYILASLANKTSRIDVEQIVGRILRQPYAEHHQEELLNMSYVFTSSQNFRDTLQSIGNGLVMAGFSGRDFRVPNAPTNTILTTEEQVGEVEVPAATTTEDNNTQPQEEEVSQPDTFDDVETTDLSDAEETENTFVSDFESFATEANEQYTNPTADLNTFWGANGDDDKNKQSVIKPEFDDAKELLLPVFMVEEKGNTLFTKAGTAPLTKAKLLQDSKFDLAKQNCDVDFTRTKAEAVQFDLENSGYGEYLPKHKNLREKEVAKMKGLIFTLAPDKQKEKFVEDIVKQLRFNEFTYQELQDYVRRALAGKSNDELSDLIAHPIETVDAFKKKLNGLLLAERQKVFREWLAAGILFVELCKKLPESIVWNKASRDSLSGSLFTIEGDIDDFEFDVISQVASMDNVRYWHRNPENDEYGYKTNGYINHYPDFIISTKSGKIIMLETKGDHLSNEESKNKLEIGKAIANEANKLDGVSNKYHYFMVYKTKQVENAHTVQEFLKILDKM